MSSSLTTALAGKTRPRLRLRRASVLTAALIAAAFCAAACGGASSADPSASQAGSNGSADKAVAYADCMRAHGVPNFPDPGSSSSGSTGINMASPTFRSAEAKCGKLSPLGAVKTTATEQQIRQAVESSDCLRDRGYPNFPDPVVTSTPPAPPGEPPAQAPSGTGGSTYYGNGILFKVPGSIDTTSAAFQAAAKACDSPLYIPGG